MRTERLLGRGGFGEVHLQSQESNKNDKRALKVISTAVKLSLTDCQRELTAMIEFTKPKYRDAAVFVDFFGWFQTDDAMFLAMEYMPLGDLERNIQDIEKSLTCTGSPLPEEEVREITRQILEGLNIMHREGFAHRDLKPQNVFVVQKHPQWWVKLGDFGLTKKRTDGTAYRTQAGTQHYMAPELFYYVEELNTETSEYTNAVDLWALGCIIHRIVTGAVPFPSLLSLRNYCRDPSKIPLDMQPTMEEAGKFVRELLMPHPAKRLLASTASESAWLIRKNNHRITLSDMEASITPRDISHSQDNYNTTSHKGLISFHSMPDANDPLTDLSASGTTSESPPSNSDPIQDRLAALPQFKPHSDTGHLATSIDSVGSTLQPTPREGSSSHSIHISASQSVRSLTTELSTASSDVKPRQEPRKQVLAQTQQEERHSHSKPSIAWLASEFQPLPSKLPGTEPVIRSAGIRPPTARENDIMRHQSYHPEDSPKPKRLTLKNDEHKFLSLSKLENLTDMPPDEEDKNKISDNHNAQPSADGIDSTTGLMANKAQDTPLLDQGRESLTGKVDTDEAGIPHKLKGSAYLEFTEPMLGKNTDGKAKMATLPTQEEYVVNNEERSPDNLGRHETSDKAHDQGDIEAILPMQSNMLQVNSTSDSGELTNESEQNSTIKTNSYVSQSHLARSEKAARLLVQNGFDVRQKYYDKEKALLWAAKTGEVDVVELLLGDWVDIEAKEWGGLTALHRAVKDGHESVVQLLLRKGANVETKDKDGYTVLITTVKYGREAIMQLLLENGANVDAKGIGGMTALHFAAKYGHGSMV